MNAPSLADWQNLFSHLQHWTRPQVQQLFVQYHQAQSRQPSLSWGDYLVQGNLLQSTQVQQFTRLLQEGYFYCPFCSRVYPRQGQPRGSCPQCSGELEVHPDRSGTGATGGPFSSGEIRSPSTVLEGSAPVQYPIHKLLGKGGYGQVYQVEDRISGRKMALKMLLSKGQSKVVVKQRFLREIQITSRLEHPHIMPVYGSGYLKDGTLYYVMKELRGGTFKERLVATKGDTDPPLRDHLEIFLKVCEAVEYAHSQGVIHRDLKPENIAVGEYGEVMVLDWGIAKCVDVDEPEEVELATPLEGEMGTPTLTQGGIMGTPGFLSPEQARGGEVSRWSDVFSLGAILYQTLTGHLPYEGNARRRITEVLMNPPLLPEERAPHRKIPRELSAVAMKAMAQDPGDRYSSAAELRRDVVLFLEGFSVSAHRDPLWVQVRKWVRRNRALTAGLVLAVVAAVSSVIVMGILEEQRRQEKIAEAVEKAKNGLREKVLAAAELEEKFPRSYEVGKQEEIEAKIQRERSLQHFLSLRRKWARAHELAPGRRDIEGELAKVEVEVGRLALLGKSYPFARAAFQRALRLGWEEGKSLLSQVEVKVKAVEKAHEKRIAAIVKELVDSPPAAKMIEEYALEMVRMGGRHVAKLLVNYLDHENKWVRMVAVEALGKMGDRRGKYRGKDVVEHLVERLEKTDPNDRPEEAKALVWALGRLRDSRANRAVFQARYKVGEGTNFWLETKLPFRWLPSPPKNQRTAEDWFQLATMTRNKGEWKEAVPLFAKAIEMDGDNPKYYMGRGYTYRLLRQWERAMEDLKEAEKMDPQGTDTYYYQGLVHQDMREYGRGIRAFTRALKINPQMYASLRARSYCYYYLRKRQQAFVDLKKAIEIHPNRPSAYNDRAMLYMFSKNYPKAVEDFNRAIQLAPGKVQGYFNRGTAYNGWKKYDLAIKDFTKALRLNPQDFRCYSNRGLAYLRSGRDKKGLADLVMAEKLGPNNLPNQMNLANYYRTHGRPEKALDCYEKALEISPGNPRVYYTRGALYARLGRHKEAAQDLEKFLKKYPNHNLAPKFRAYIRKHLGR